MNKLPNNVVAFATRGRAYSPTSRSARPVTHRLRRDEGALVCRWQPDPTSQQLRCAWSFEDAERDLEQGPRLLLAG
jgi:hypothetical protein